MAPFLSSPGRSGSVSCAAACDSDLGGEKRFVGAEEQAQYLGSSMSLPSPSECRESLISMAHTEDVYQPDWLRFHVFPETLTTELGRLRPHWW